MNVIQYVKCANVPNMFFSVKKLTALNDCVSMDIEYLLEFVFVHVNNIEYVDFRTLDTVHPYSRNTQRNQDCLLVPCI